MELHVHQRLRANLGECLNSVKQLQHVHACMCTCVGVGTGVDCHTAGGRDNGHGYSV